MRGTGNHESTAWLWKTYWSVHQILAHVSILGSTGMEVISRGTEHQRHEKTDEERQDGRIHHGIDSHGAVAGACLQ